MTYRIVPCGRDGCAMRHGVVYERKAARKASDDSARGLGADADSGDIGCLPGLRAPQPVGASASEGRKALSTTG